MPDFVRNKLIIKCDNIEMRNKIRNVIFFENSKKEQIFSMQKLLPIPKEFSDTVEYNEFGYDWCIAIWGSKWEVLNSRISESGDTISISYLTATDSNAKWVEAMCRYIMVTSYIDNLKGDIKISVTHSIYRLYDDCGIKMEWTPEVGYNYMEGEILSE